jgi:hypothetical protein
MAAATTSIGATGRGVVMSNVSVIQFTLTLSATVYATASGGIPFDLTTVLQQAVAGEIPGGIAPNYTQALNPADIVGVIPVGLTTNGFIPASIAVGTATFDPIPWMSTANASASPGALKTCPCTMRLWGTGAANAAHLAEIADGAVTDAVTILLLVNRNGANN